MKFSEFILAHDGDDLGQLALARSRFAGEVDSFDLALADGGAQADGHDRAKADGGASGFDLALTTLEVRRKLRDKVPEWYALPSLVYPLRLSGEQCSSSVTARYKAAVAAACVGGFASHYAFSDSGASRVAQSGQALRVVEPTCVMSGSLRLADLTGGLGVDCWAFAQVADEVLYNEMRPELAAAAEHNFRELGLTNVRVRNCQLVPSGARESCPAPTGNSLAEVLDGFRPDVIFLDPARRAADGRKVFRLEDCQPDVLQLLPELLATCQHVLLKLSPMADITLVCKQLGCVKEVHVVAADGECKELLLLLERDYEGPYTMTIFEDGAVMEIPGQAGNDSLDSGMDFSGEGTHVPKPMPTLGPVRERGPQEASERRHMGGVAERRFGDMSPLPEGALFLFEPGKAMMKAGAFEVPCQFGLEKLGKHSHLYVGAAVPEELQTFGKVFEIQEVVPLNKRSVKDIGRKYPKADVTARNIPLTSDQLRKKLGVADGGPVHIFGVHQDNPNQNLLIVTR